MRPTSAFSYRSFFRKIGLAAKSGAFAVFGVLIRMRDMSAQTALWTGIFKLSAAAIFAIALMRGAAGVFAIPCLTYLAMGTALTVSASRS
jgi:hypothetical protein